MGRPVGSSWPVTGTSPNAIPRAHIAPFTKGYATSLRFNPERGRKRFEQTNVQRNGVMGNGG